MQNQAVDNLLLESLVSTTSIDSRSLKKRCRTHPAGGLGVPPSFTNPPKSGGYRGLNKTFSELSVTVIDVELWDVPT